MTQIAQLTKAIALSLVGVLAGCGTVDTKTVVSNSDAYLASNFTPDQLAQPVRTLVEKGEQLPKQFNRIEYKTIADLDEEGKIYQITSASTFINLGNGYIQNKTEYSRNGVPYRINLALTFAGIYRLKTQTTFVDRSNALYPLDTKEMSKFDRGLGKPQAGQTYGIDAKTGNAPQLMNFSDEKHVCTASQAVQAASVHASLSGTAIPLECTMTGANGVVVGKTKLMWISDLGVAFQTEYTNSRTTSRYRLESVSIQR
ncbi:hypothetical protein ACG0Z6_01040 [Roseateles sp. BYS180W]|uniref:Lipoprotein n=1 Tax=Roseateles rivi TaxID=3299028 RepID=A0ABW7FR53_9BURK